MAHLDALTSVTDVRVDSLIWGGVKGAPPPAVGPLYDTEFGDNPQFGGGYLPGDFKLPELPPDDLVKVLRLVMATDSAEFMSAYKIEFGDALVPLIGEAREMAQRPRQNRRLERRHSRASEPGPGYRKSDFWRRTQSPWIL